MKSLLDSENIILPCTSTTSHYSNSSASFLPYFSSCSTPLFCSNSFFKSCLTFLLFYLCIFSFGLFFLEISSSYFFLYFSIIPPIFISAFFIYKFCEDVFSMQLIYTLLGGISLCIPLFIILPFIRHGCALLFRFIYVFFFSSYMNFFSQIYDLVLWGVLDIFFFSVFTPCFLKYFFSKQILKKNKDFYPNFNLRSLVVYTLVLTQLTAMIQSTFDANSVIKYVRKMDKAASMTMQGREGANVLHLHRFSFSFTFVLFNFFYFFLLQSANAIIISSLLFKFFFLQKKKKNNSILLCTKVCLFPLLLEGIPAYFSKIMKILSHKRMIYLMNESRRSGFTFGSNLSPSAFSTSVFFKIATSSFFFYFCTFLLSVTSLCFAFFLSRYWFSEIQESLQEVEKHEKKNKVCSIMKAKFFLDETDFYMYESEKANEDDKSVDEEEAQIKGGN